MSSPTNNSNSQNTKGNKKYIIQIDGYDDSAIMDSAWYADNKDKLFEKYNGKNVDVFEMADYDENDARDTDQYAITIKGRGTEVMDASWYKEKKDKLHAKYGSDATVQRIRYVDYWGDKATSDESTIIATQSEIESLNEQLKGYSKGTPEYANIEAQILDKKQFLSAAQSSYDNNPRVIAARAQQEEYQKQLPSMLRGQIAERRKPKFAKGNEVFDEKNEEGTIDLKPKKSLEEIKNIGSTIPRKNILEDNIESQRDMTSSMSPIERAVKIGEDIRSGKAPFSIDETKLSASESFLDAYDYLLNNHRSIAQGTWYNIWESVSKKDYDLVHDVLEKLENKFGNVNEVTEEDIDSTLSPEEKILLQSYFLLAEEESKTSGAFKAGEAIGESSKIMAEMAIWSAITYVTGGAAAPAAATSISVSLGRGVMKIGWGLLKGLGKWALKTGVKSIAMSAISPTSHKRVAKNKLQIGDDGRLQNDTDDVLKYFAQNAVEYATEMTGEGLVQGAKVIGATMKGTKLANAVSKVSNTKLGQLGNYVWNSKAAKVMGNMGIQSFPAELLEEFEGAVINDITNLEDGAIEDFFDKDNLGITLISLAPMTIIGTGISTASMISASRGMSSAEQNLMRELELTADSDIIEEVIRRVREAATTAEISDALDELVGQIGATNVSPEALKAMTDYGKAAAKYNTLFNSEYGKNVESVQPFVDSYLRGKELSEQDLYDVAESESNARQAVIDSGASLSEDVLNKSSLDLLQYIEENEHNLSEESKTALADYITAKSVKEGLDSALKYKADSAVSSYNSIANKCATDGVLVVGMLDGRKVYIKTPCVIENGKIKAPSDAASHMLETVDSMTGEVVLASSDLLESVSQTNLDDYNTRMGNIIRDGYLQIWTDALNTKSAASKLRDVSQLVGQKVLINTENGGMAEVEVVEILSDGRVLIKGKKGDLGGNNEIAIPASELYDSLSRDNNGNLIGQPTNTPSAGTSQTPNDNTGATSAPVAPVVPSIEGENLDFREGTYTIAINGVPTEVEVTNQNDSNGTITYEYVDENGRRKSARTSIDEFNASMAAARYAHNETSDVEQTEAPVSDELPPFPENPNDVPVIPTTNAAPQAAQTPASAEINWDELFEQDKEGYLAALQNEFGNEAIDVLREEIEDAQKKIDKLSKKDLSSQNERIENRRAKAQLQARINELTQMAERLSVPAQTVAAATEQAIDQTEVPSNRVESQSGFVFENGVVTNPTVIEVPNAEGTTNKIMLAEKDGKWGSAAYVVLDDGNESGTPHIQLDNMQYNSMEEAIAGALSYFDFYKGMKKGSPSTKADSFMKYVNDTYLNENASETVGDSAPAATKPQAPTVVDNPAVEAKRLEDKLAEQLGKTLPKAQKQDLARSAGKKIGNLFATREEYESYLGEDATNFGEYNNDVETGVDESFANRPPNEMQVSEDTLAADTEAKKLATEAVLEALDGYVDVEIASAEQTQAMLDVKDELSDAEMMTVYHGSGAKFDAFDHSHMGEGEGAQAHGWGTYVAVDKKTSVAYARQMGGGTSVQMNGKEVLLNASNQYDPLYYVVALMKSYKDIEKVRRHIADSLYDLTQYLDYYKEDVAADRDSYEELIEKQDKLEKALDVFDSNEWSIEEKKAQLYTVDIADDNGSNYLYEEGASDSQIERISDACEKEGIEFLEVAAISSELSSMFGVKDGRRLYRALAQTLGSDKAASEFLSRAGFVGIKYEGRRDGQCYVVFNEADAKIIDHTEFYQTTNGTVYGWTDGKKIFLTEAGINPNTPVHEYTHLWAKAMMQNNPKGWSSIKNLLKGTPVWNEVVNDPNYSNIKNNKDAIASEALSRISGGQNAAKLEQMAQQMIDNAKGSMRKAEARGLIQNMKDALAKFWNWVGTNLFGIENFESMEQVTDRVLWDLLNKTDLGTLSEGQVETQIVTDPQVIAELDASPKRTGYRNVVQNKDGSFSSPMAYWLQSTKDGAKSRVETAKFELGKWEEAEEHPELVDENGKVTLVKPNKKTVDNVAYDPYIHNRLEPVNLQFKDAWKRDDLVYVETEVAENDINDGYHAEKALLPVGVHSWSNGSVMLSRYDKPVRIMPWEAVADAWVERLNGEGVHFDVVPPALRQPLVDRGVEILPPHNGMGKDCNDAYETWKKENPQSVSRDLTSSPSPKVESNQTAERAQTKDAAKIAKSIESLRELAIHSKESKESRPKVLVDMLAQALNIDKSQRSNKSKRNKYILPNGETISVRASDHNSDSNTYIKFNFNQKYNLAITFKSKHSKNTFKANENVRLDEYVYFVEDIKQYDGSVLSEVAASLADFLESGIYTDTTGLTKYTINTSPEGAAPRTKENYTPEILSRKGENNTKFVEQFEFKQNNERQELEYSDEFRRLQEESARMSGQLVSEKDGVQQAAIRGLVGGIGRTLQRELDRATSGRGNKLRTVVNDSKGTSFDIIENVDGRLFHDIFEIVRTYLPNGELVDLHDNYDDAICYITSDGLAGFAVDKDGNLISVYSLYGKSKKGFLGAIKDLITEAGATHLDGYNSEKQPLAEIYSKVFGWKVASMMDYNMEYDHDNIAENHGMPQVAFMVNTEADIETKHFDKDQYDEAVAYQQEQVEVSQRTDAQNSAIDYLSGDSRTASIEHAVNKEASKLGVAVTYKTRSEMPKGHQNDKGYYNTKTGEIVICTENATSIADAIQTILHEAVAHNGLRQLMGNRFNEFINRVYNALDAKTKAKVDALATAHYNGNTAVAMEEYMATLAEGMDFKSTAWESIKEIFNKIINAILGRSDIKIGDKELSYILRASYNNMVNPNTMNTIEGWAKDTNMRNELGINEATPKILSRTGIDPYVISSQTAAQVYDDVVEKRWQEFQRQFQDAYQPVRVAIDAIQQETGNIPIEDYENFLLAQNQASSRSRVEIDTFERKFYSPIIKQANAIIDKILESRGLNKKDKAQRAEVYKELREYMIAKHGLERNAYYQNKTGEMRDFAGLTALFGLDAKDYALAEVLAQDKVDTFERELGRLDDPATGAVVMQSAEIDALWDKIKAATDKTLRHSYESGLLSRQQYNDIKSMYEFYIPLRGFDETTAEDVYAYSRFEGNRFNPAVVKTKGRTSVADDPLAFIMNMAESEIAQGNKNRAKQALYNFLLNRAAIHDKQNSLMQLEDVWYEEATDAYGNKIMRIAAPNRAAGETYEMFQARMEALEQQGLAQRSGKGKVDVGMRFQKAFDEAAHYVYVKVNGVEKAIFINGNPKAAEAINGTNIPKMGDGMKKVKEIQRTLSSMFTNYSLEFTARNFFRDFVYSHINVAMRASNPDYRRRFRKNWRKNNMRTILSMLKAYKSGAYDNRVLTADEAMFVEFIENGGQTGYTLINSVESHKKDLENAIARMRDGVSKGGIKDSTIFKNTLGAIELLNEAAETVTRYAAYKTSREMGAEIESAISKAKEITVNFNTKGAQDGKGVFGVIARYLGAVKYFFNASVQGVQNLKQMAEKGKGKFGAVVGGTVGLGIMMPIIQSALWELLGDDDEEKWYWNIPDYERQNNLCFVLGGGKYIKIPLPIGFREMYGIGDIIAGGLMNKKFTRDYLSTGVDVANKIATIVLPLNPLEGAANGLSLLESGQDMVLPDFTQGMIQNRTNKDWKGAPIQKENSYNVNDPEWTKAFDSNPDWLTGLSKWCYEHLVIDGKPVANFSPEKLDNSLNNLFGGIYSLTKKTGRTVSMIWNEDNRTMSNVPLVGVIIGSDIDSDERRINSEYWDINDYYNERLYLIESTAEKFGLTLNDVFAKVPEGEARAKEHHPKMSKIYNSDYFPIMQEWYLAHKGTGEEDEYGQKVLGLDQIKNKIKGLNRKVANAEDEDTQHELIEQIAELEGQYETSRRELVDRIMELE